MNLIAYFVDHRYTGLTEVTMSGKQFAYPFKAEIEDRFEYVPYRLPLRWPGLDDR
jgi:hypothetical protein